MKKIFVFLSSLLLVIVLVACNKETKSQLVVSKLFGATEQFNNVIELYNNSDSDIDLKNHKIRFYTNGATEVSQEITLVGVIKANDYFVLSGNGFGHSDHLDKIDQKHDASLPYNGNDTIELAKGKKVLDTVGFLGLDIEFSRNITLIRLGEKENYVANGLFDKYNYINYIPDIFQYLKNDNHEIKTLEQLLKGPMLEDRYKEMPYADPTGDNIGGGGAALTESDYLTVSDGDTATFRGGNGYPGGSMRYFYLDTPEVNGSYVTAEAWGYVASKYNKQYLLNVKNDIEVHLQSIPGYNLNEGYGRNIGLVWVNGHLSQFMIVAEGLSKAVDLSYNSYDLLLTYKNVPYLTFMIFAEKRAVENGWGTKGFPAKEDGEKSPDWNYQGNSLATQDPIWEPHLPIPWLT